MARISCSDVFAVTGRDQIDAHATQCAVSTRLPAPPPRRRRCIAPRPAPRPAAQRGCIYCSANAKKYVLKKLGMRSNEELWWQNYRRKRLNHETVSTELILRKSFVEMLREYTSHSSIAGVKKITDSNIQKILRMMWSSILCAMFGITCYFIHYTWSDTLSKPFIVTMESTTYPISNINFPAIALCNSNRISRKSLKAIVSNINTHHNYTSKELQWFYMQHGRFLDFTWNERLRTLAAVEYYNSQYYKNSQQIVSVMKKLAPNCDEMLLSCMWGGDIVNCSDIFSVRRTVRGHCCVFNYVLDYNSADSPNQTIADVKKQNQAGYYNGLNVFLDPIAEDYVYPLNNIKGFDVLVFDSTHFADPTGGGVIHRVLEINKAIYVELQSVKQIATTEVRKYSTQTRNCLFRDEEKSFGNMYSYSACIIRCKIKTVKSLCKCTPYFLPITENDGPVCNLEHLRCLNKYKEKLLYIFPINVLNTIGLELEIQDSLYCPECLPDCEFTQHFTRVSKIPLKIDNEHAQKQFKGIQFSGLKGINLSNKCFLSIYQSTPDGNLDRLDVVSYWFEVLSTFGGFAGVVIGFSIISIVELIYFFCIRFFQIFHANLKNY
ncbi:sodium channel protein Nach-like [Achroia grisella]|uniref:sodium channel protein Nach-like n=1 Tax=Achroia grisella TaxID=688607 RepID=UPI0027D2EDAF|nr:sodium channel protein Nach-like [Achroia grisella]